MNKVFTGAVFFIVIFFAGFSVFAQEDQSADFIFKGKLVNGSIKEVNTVESLITVDSKSGETINFVIDPEETVIWIDDEEKDIKALSSGMEAEFKYTENEREQKVLSWVDIVLKEQLEGVPEKEKQKVEEITPEKELLEEDIVKEEDVEIKEDMAVKSENKEPLPAEDKKTVEKAEVKRQ